MRLRVVNAFDGKGSPHAGVGKLHAVVSGQDHRDLVLAPSRPLFSYGHDRAPVRQGTWDALLLLGARERSSRPPGPLSICLHPLIEGASRDPEPAADGAGVPVLPVMPQPGRPHPDLSQEVHRSRHSEYPALMRKPRMAGTCPGAVTAFHGRILVLLSTQSDSRGRPTCFRTRSPRRRGARSGSGHRTRMPHLAHGG